MNRLRTFALLASAMWELLRYDALIRLGGFGLVRKILLRPASQNPDNRMEWPQVCSALQVATALYWKPVLCLQNSVVTAILLRRRGFRAEVVIGCRPDPFFSHAWVEIDGHVANDSPVYQQKLPALARL